MSGRIYEPGHAITYNNVVFDRTLPIQVKGFYCLIASYFDDPNEEWQALSLSAIAKGQKCGRQTVLRRMTILVERGIIDRRDEQGTESLYRMRDHLYEMPQQPPHKPKSSSSRGSRWKRVREKVRDRDGTTCRYCGIDADENFHVDHLTPRSRGGTDDLNNLVVACPSCNLRKGAMTEDEFNSRGPQ